ncbi:substrate-binding and VWA domain-containing protein [Actinocorallia longicatena]|uniref:Substrate-binding domain-containing protein n=1 Tax=Actinocorallia longicatena TaxID=111803 RepID=A0ABP6QL60_9ACTN
MTRPPGDHPGEGGFGSSSDFPTADSTDWFSPRSAASSSSHEVPQAEPAQPEWLNRASGQPYGSGGFTGASDPGGHSYGGNGLASSPPSDSQPYLSAPVPGGGGGSSAGFDRPFPTGPGESVGGGHGPGGGSDEYVYGSGGYGSRKKRKRGALIGPMAGAVGLALLLGVAVYAFTEKSGGCSGDAVTLNLAVAKEIAPAVKNIADGFSDDDKNCAKAIVTATEPSAVRTLLTGEGVTSTTATKPDVWIPDSSLWTGMVEMRAKGAATPTKTKLATSPVVVIVPKTLYSVLKSKGFLDQPSWDNLLKAAGGLEGGAVTKNDLINPKLLDMRVLDPNSTGSGMASISMLKTLLAGDAAAAPIFAGITQKIRKTTRPTIEKMYARFGQDTRGRFPLLIAPEQSVMRFNNTKPKEPAAAIYPTEGEVSMDYPVVLTTSDKKKVEATHKLEAALTTPDAVKKYQALGFRTNDFKAPATFTEANGLSAKRISPLPVVSAEEIYKITQDWAKLSLGIRMLAVLDISGTMAQPIVPGGKSRMQTILDIAGKGLANFSPDSEIGVWAFSTNLVGKQDWKEAVPVAQLDKKFGSISQVDRIKQALVSVQALPTGDTGLYDTILGSYAYMRKTYAQDRINSIVLFTDGIGNDDKNGISHGQLLQKMQKLISKDQPVQLIVISIGSDKKVLKLLTSITGPTGGAAYIPTKPEEISKIFLEALSKRMCDPQKAANAQKC